MTLEILQATEIKITPGLYLYQLRNDKIGREVVKIVNSRFKGNSLVEIGPNHRSIDGFITGSNVYRKAAIDSAMAELMPDFAPLSPSLSEILFGTGKMPDAYKTSCDLGAVIYSFDGPNSEPARLLAAQAESMGFDIQLPMVFYGLKVEPDPGCAHGLRLSFADKSEAYHVPILAVDRESEHFIEFSSTNPGLRILGLPDTTPKPWIRFTVALEDKGDGMKRKLSAHLSYGGGHKLEDGGMCRFLRQGQDLNASLLDLGYSLPDGRYLFVSFRP